MTPSGGEAKYLSDRPRMRRAKTPSYRRCGAEKEMWVHILSECPGVGKGEDADLGLCQDESGTNKRGETEGIVVLSKGTGLLNSTLRI